MNSTANECTATAIAVFQAMNIALVHDTYDFSSYMYENSFPACGSNYLPQVPPLKWSRRSFKQKSLHAAPTPEQSITISMEWPYHADSMYDAIQFDYCHVTMLWNMIGCQLSDRRRNSVNLRKSPGRFSYGQGTRLIPHRISTNVISSPTSVVLLSTRGFK